MNIDLTRDEIWFLKALRAAGERGRIVSAAASIVGLIRLVEAQYGVMTVTHGRDTSPPNRQAQVSRSSVTVRSREPPFEGKAAQSSSSVSSVIFGRASQR